MRPSFFSDSDIRLSSRLFLYEPVLERIEVDNYPRSFDRLKSIRLDYLGGRQLLCRIHFDFCIADVAVLVTRESY